MTTKEFTARLNQHTERSESGRIRNVRNALSVCDKLPTYSTPVDSSSAAWFLLAFALCPNTKKEKAVEWIKEIEQFWQGIGIDNPLFALSGILGSVEIAQSVKELGFCRATGQMIIHMDDGATRSIPKAKTPYNINFERLKIYSIIFIPKAVVMEIAKAVEAAQKQLA